MFSSSYVKQRPFILATYLNTEKSWDVVGKLVNDSITIYWNALVSLGCSEPPLCSKEGESIGRNSRRVGL